MALGVQGEALWVWGEGRGAGWVERDLGFMETGVKGNLG